MGTGPIVLHTWSLGVIPKHDDYELRLRSQDYGLILNSELYFPHSAFASLFPIARLSTHPCFQKRARIGVQVVFP